MNYTDIFKLAERFEKYAQSPPGPGGTEEEAKKFAKKMQQDAKRMLDEYFEEDFQFLIVPKWKEPEWEYHVSWTVDMSEKGSATEDLFDWHGANKIVKRFLEDKYGNVAKFVFRSIVDPPD